MSKIITPIATTVKLITQPKQGQYGGFQSILFIDDADREIWKSFPLDAAELEVLKPGMRVRLIPNGSSRGGKPSHVIELIDELPEMNMRGLMDSCPMTKSERSQGIFSNWQRCTGIPMD